MTFELQYFFACNGYSLRKADDSDVKDLVEIINDAYSYQNEDRGELRTNFDHLKKRISETNFFVIQYHDKIVGCVYIESKNNSLHFGLFTLILRHRGKGVAGQVMSAIEDLALTNNFDAIELDYMSVAPWLKVYYEKYGFIASGESEEWGKVRLVRMKKSLE